MKSRTVRPAGAQSSARRAGLALVLSACASALVAPAPRVAAAAAGSAPGARLGDRLDKLGRLRDEAHRAQGPRVYAALRSLWLEYDQGDPAELEEALRELASDRALSPPARVYAGLLEAYARRRRGDFDGARAQVSGLGYVGKWLVAGPFDNEGKAGFARAFGPEQDLREPLSFGRTYDGKERPVRWRAVPDVAQFGWLDAGALVRPSEKSCVYAASFVQDTRKGQGARTVSLWLGSAGATKVFWNGEAVLEDTKYRSLDAERFATRVLLREGANRLTVKTCGDEDGAIFSLRVGAADGGVDPFVRASADPALASEAAAQRFKKDATKVAGGTLEGPITAFERLAKGEDPALLEAYARYLSLTASDDPAEHAARAHARKAADKAPTIARLLLAGELTEGRNQTATFLDRAEELVRKGGTNVPIDERVDVLLARAAHARSGANFRDAIPSYDKVLGLDPDNVRATLARVELYSEANLKETALALLERALSRRPKSVALLRATASSLEELSRTSEAEAVEDRYAALRFDDPHIAQGKLDVALARRDRAAAGHWVDRLLAANPDSALTLGHAARAYVALGDRPKAVASYRRALELAPEDTDAMRALANVYAVGGSTEEQLRLLRKVLELRPQEKDVREYVAHTEPEKPRPDEVYTRPAKEFLALRGAPALGRDRRTLVDLQVTTVFPNGLASRYHQVVYQPLTDAAAAQGREYAFGFEADTETVQLRGARVYRKNGQVDEAAESGDGPADNPQIAMYTSQRVYYVHFPRLFPGDVVELLYRTEDVAPRNAFADYFGEVVYMQSQEPVSYAEYVLMTPKSRTFHFNQPAIPGVVRTAAEQGDQRIERFVARDLAPVDPEPLQPPFASFLGHVHVSTYKSWDDMGKWYWGLVKDQFVADDEVKRRVAEVTRGLTTEAEKVRAIYDYVVQRTRYVALEFGIHGFKPYRCAQIFARGFGDCKDKATLIVTMLKEAGIPSTIVILRTGMRGDFESSPASLAPFDHAIAYVPSLDLYLDGTAEFTGSRELPSMDRGALGLRIHEGKPVLVHLPEPPPEESVTSRKVEATLAADGSAQLEWRADVTGVHAGSWRGRYNSLSTQKKRVQEDLANEFPGLELAQVTANDLEKIEEPVAVRARGKVSQLARKDGNTMTVSAGPREHMVREYATLSARKRDLRIFALTADETETTLHLPAGAKITGQPRAARGDAPFGSYQVEVEISGARVRTKTRVALKKSRIAAAEYPAFRAFCEEVDRALGQRVTYTRN
ncbi:MAG: DUF3857 domain-containing protein [Myxococcales bacterium]|nr:DUF3857 domain-containing protein [Myxococcales bacterium]